MANYERLAVTAQRLLDKNGRTVSIVKHGKTPQDSDKPWRGQSQYPEAVVEGRAAFVAPSDLGHTVRDEENVKRADKVALFAALNDGGHKLETFDVIQDGDSVWHIKRAQVLQPSDLRLLYMFEVVR